jgi:hypothetical protein
LQPTPFSQWLDEEGEPVVVPWKLDLLASQYSTSRSRSKEGVNYQDVRIRHDTWASLEEYFPRSNWPMLVGRVVESSMVAAMEAGRQRAPLEGMTIYCHPEAISAVVLLGAAG